MPDPRSMSVKLMDIYDRLYTAYGPQYWWPGDSKFEVIVGAILTQSTAWTNVETVSYTHLTLPTSDLV